MTLTETLALFMLMFGCALAIIAIVFILFSNEGDQ